MIIDAYRAGVGGQPTWDPSLLTTALWLDATDAETITLESGAVAQWADKSGNNRHATQGTAAARPTVSAAAVNGRNAILFDGVNDSLATAAAVLTITHSLFVVATSPHGAIKNLISQYSPTGTGRFTINVNQQSTGAASSGNLWFFNSATANGGGFGGGFAHVAFPANTAMMLASLCTSGSENWRGYKNGVLFDTATMGAMLNQPLRLGTDGNTVGFGGMFCEVIALAGVASDEVRQRIEGYLHHKWAFGLPPGHPYELVPPTV